MSSESATGPATPTGDGQSADTSPDVRARGRSARPPDVTDVVVDTEKMELRLSFDDGLDGAISLVELRLNCPCATCRAARQAGRQPWPPPGRDATLGIRNAGLIGAWGLNVVWNDGHATGIYPFEELHEWIRSGEATLRPDSGLGA